MVSSNTVKATTVDFQDLRKSVNLDGQHTSLKLRSVELRNRQSSLILSGKLDDSVSTAAAIPSVGHVSLDNLTHTPEDLQKLVGGVAPRQSVNDN